MKGDRVLWMAAVTQDGLALAWASEEMKGDRKLCMAAVAQHWKALKFVSQEMKTNNAILTTAKENLHQRETYTYPSIWFKDFGIPKAQLEAMSPRLPAFDEDST